MPRNFHFCRILMRPHFSQQIFRINLQYQIYSLAPFWCRGQERVELYPYSPYGPYGLYRASVPVQGRILSILLHGPINIRYPRGAAQCAKII